MPSKFLSRDLELGGGQLLQNGTVIVDSNGNIDAPVTTTNLTLTGSATVGTTLGVTGASTLAAVTATTLTTSGLLTASGGAVLSTSTTINDFLILETSSRSGAGAIPQTAPACNLTTTAADALTLADGTVDHQILTITMIVDGGDGTLTPATPLGYATITFNSVGDSVILKWIPTLGWAILSNFGCTVA